MKASESSTLPRQSELPASAMASSLWLRLGFFGGASLVMIGLRALFGGDSTVLHALTSVLIGAGLGAYSLRRSWALLQEAETSPQALRGARLAVRSLQNS